jgi:CRP-like cAMP-binding protein
MSLGDDIRNLSRIPLFAEVEPEALRLIAFAGETRILRAGDVLFHRGETSDCGYIVLTGSIAIDAAGDGSPAVQIVGPNSLIGEIALISQTERPATALAREPSTVLKISRPLFHRVLKEFPLSAQRLHAAIQKRLFHFTRELEQLRQGSMDPLA